MTDEPAAAALRKGERYGRYRIRHALASGGMASVYVAQLDGVAGFGKLVALKRIHPHLAREGDFVRMFLDEARITSRIAHANVCAVTDFGEEEGTYYLAMELLHGESFSSVVRACLQQDVAPIDRARLFAKLLADACEGLHAAHELRDDHGEPMHVVHRDVSPQNLFVTYDGVAKVLDFGVAKARHRLQDETVGQIKGKFAYLAPEQVKGAELDRRVDVWALGVVSWEMLTGKRLFRRPTEMETMFAVASDEIRPPSVACPGLPSVFDDVVMHALERDPDARFPTARELGRSLLRAAAALGAPLGQAELSERLALLFPEASARRLTLEAAEALEPTTVDAPADVPVDALVDAVEGVREPDRADPGEGAPLSAAVEPLLRSGVHEGARPSRRGALAGLSLLLGSLGAVGAWLAVQRTPDPAPVPVPVHIARELDVPGEVHAPAAPPEPAPPEPALPEPAVAALEVEPVDAGAPVVALAARRPGRTGTRAASAPPPSSVAPEVPDVPAPEPVEPTGAMAPADGSGEGRICLLSPDVRIEEARVDGEPRPTIGCRPSVRAGEHDVEVVLADGTRHRRRVLVAPDATLRLRVPFE